jgi:hypothetical protein
METRHEVGEPFVAALQAADLAGIGNCFSADVGFAALLPRGMVEAPVNLIFETRT